MKRTPDIHINSGATVHMTNNKEFFDELYTEVKDEVYTANGKAVKVEGTGKGRI